MKIIWSNKAMNLLLEITSFIAENVSVYKANLFQLDLFSFINEKLKPHPERYPPCRFIKLKEAGYRCFNFKKYVIVYKVVTNEIVILAIVASRRNPDFFNNLAD